MKIKKRRCNYRHKQRRKNTGRKKGLHAKKMKSLRQMRELKNKAEVTI